MSDLPHRLRTENRRDPDAIDQERPLLTWAWDGPVTNQAQIQLHGPRGTTEGPWLQADGSIRPECGLEALTTYRWQVRVRHAQGVSAWSAPATLITGLRGKPWQATWIGARDEAPPEAPSFFRNGGKNPPPMTDDTAAVLLRREFIIASPPRRAVLAVCGLGYGTVTIDGRRLGPAVLDPPFTDYGVRLNYRTFDVTSLLVPGRHCLGATLGHGFYHLLVPDLFQIEKAAWRRNPRLLLRLEIEDAAGDLTTLVSDPAWQVSSGVVRFACLRGGESHDLRCATPGWDMPGYVGDWPSALAVTAPSAPLTAAPIPPMVVAQRRVAQSVVRRADGAQVVDFGRHLTGWAELTTSGPAGTAIRIEHIELPHNPGECSGHTYGRFQVGEVTLAGTGEPERFAPTMTCHGFRYAVVHGAPPLAPDDLRAAVVHTDLERIGRFACSDDRLNALHEASARTLLSAAHGMPGAEETREKMGWSWDADLLQDANQTLFDTTALYGKFQQDLIDAQEANGHIGPIVPTNGWGKLAPDGGREYCDDPWWGSTLAGVTWGLWRWTGDRAWVERGYAPAVRYLRWLGSTAEDGFLTWNLGDWLDEAWGWPQGPGLTPIVFASTAGWYRLARLCERMARLLGRTDEASAHAALAGGIAARFNARWFDPAQGYTIRSQSGQGIPLAAGLVPAGHEPTVRRALAQIAGADHWMTAGFLGARPTVEELAWGDEGADPDLAYRLLTAEERGWMWMLQEPEATVAEHLRGSPKHLAHHPYAAFVAASLHLGVAGWRCDPALPGCTGLILRPGLMPQISQASASHQTPHGLFTWSWRRGADGLLAEVRAPQRVRLRLELAGPPRSLPEGSDPLGGGRPGGTSWLLPPGGGCIEA